MTIWSPTSRSTARWLDLAQQGVDLKQRDVERKTHAGQEQFRLAARPRQRRHRASSPRARNCIRQAAALQRQDPAARQSRSAARGISALCAGQGRARPWPSAISTTPCCARRWSGIATQVDQIQLGRFVIAGTPVFSVIDVANPWVDANLKESDFTYVAVGQQVDIDVDAFPDHRVQGHDRLAVPRHRRAIRDPAAAERHRQFRQGGAARAGADLFRQQ